MVYGVLYLLVLQAALYYRTDGARELEILLSNKNNQVSQEYNKHWKQPLKNAEHDYCGCVQASCWWCIQACEISQGQTAVVKTVSHGQTALDQTATHKVSVSIKWKL